MFEKTEKLTLHVEGMSCAHCVAHVTDALKAVKGVKSAEVSLEAKSAEVAYLPSKTGREALIAAVKAAGYEAE